MMGYLAMTFWFMLGVSIMENLMYYFKYRKTGGVAWYVAFLAVTIGVIYGFTTGAK